MSCFDNYNLPLSLDMRHRTETSSASYQSMKSQLMFYAEMAPSLEVFGQPKY